MSIIWLPKKEYGKYQTCQASFYAVKGVNYCATSIRRNYEFEKEINKLEVYFIADSTGYLYCNDKLIVGTNAKPTGGFVFKERKTTEFYWTKQVLKFDGETKCINLLAYVQMGPSKLWDFSSGFGGFTLKGTVYFKDGTSKSIETDDTWLIRLENFDKRYSFDGSIGDHQYVNAEIKDYKWTARVADIRIPLEEELSFDNKFVIPANSKKIFKRDFPIVYGCYIAVEIRTKSLVIGEINLQEVENNVGTLSFKASKNESFRYFDMWSVGAFELTLENSGDGEAEVILHIYRSYIKVEKYVLPQTKNAKLNDLFTKCYVAAENCMQTMILDSPKHLEPLASCSGDYQIISLTHGIVTGDYELAKHCVMGYAELMERNKGVNSNTSYALTFISWLWKIYLITGDKDFVKHCMPGVNATLMTFKSFVGEGGIIDHPYSYCFADWIVVDGNRLFNPPAALGQTIFNMNYYDALVSAANAAKEIGDEKFWKTYLNRSIRLKRAINRELFNKERGLYCEGQTKPDIERTYPAGLLFSCEHNIDKVYYRKHANILGAAFGLQSKKVSRSLLNKVFGELKDQEIQPFFQFFTMQAIKRVGYETKYTMTVIKEWLKHVKITDKGLPEGFYKPQEDYVFDFSHGWGCSPLYWFIMNASGLEILEPGMRKVKLSPKTLRMNGISYSIGTPFGFIEIVGDKVVSKPKEITIVED